MWYKMTLSRWYQLLTFFSRAVRDNTISSKIKDNITAMRRNAYAECTYAFSDRQIWSYDLYRIDQKNITNVQMVGWDVNTA